MTKQYDVPKCFLCKDRPAVNMGFCDECMQNAVDEKVKKEAEDTNSLSTDVGVDTDL